MRCLRWITVILWLYSASSGAPLENTVTIHGKGTQGPYSLGYRNILSNTVRVFHEDRQLPSTDYSVELMEGIIRFGRPVAVGDSFDVVFEYLPFSLKERYFVHEYVTRTGNPAEEVHVERKETQFTSSDLSIRGSKGFSIETGAGAGGLSQSLNLTVKGNLVPGLRTSAHIFDKTATGTGVTRRLEELDKIYVEAESDDFRGVFGDFDYVGKDDRFLSFRRKLTGLNAEYSSAGNGLKGAAAFFPGEYESIVFDGQDGRLGPYFLPDRGGKEGAAVLSGSERVYLDGVLQKRGGEDDYVIDYEAGAIEFTPSKIIRDETRITVDYEIARQEFSRSFYATSFDLQGAKGLRFFSNLIQEGDNKNAPKTFELTSENRRLLEQAGDDQFEASRDGAAYVGEGMGDYVLVADSLGNSYYEYAGPGLGDYRVSFSFVGENAGSYTAAGAGVFIYSGAGLGNYDPVILLPLPQLKRYGSLGSRWSSGDSAITLEAELAGSRFDKNTLSDLDGAASGVSGAAEARYHRNLFDDGFIGINSNFRSIGTGSIFPGRIDEVERYREYDLDPELDPGGEKLEKVNLQAGMDSDRRIDLGIGLLSHPGLTDRKRYFGSTNWRLTDRYDLFARTERTSGERVWWKRSAGLTASYQPVQPSFRIDYESRDGDGGFEYYEYLLAVPATYYGRLSGSTELNYRDEKYLDIVWRDKFRSGSIRQKISLPAGRSGFSGQLEGSYYRKEYRDFPGTDSEQKTGWTRLAYSDPGGNGSLFISERLSSSSERLQARNYIPVEPGDGEYRLEDGEYIRDPEGDYILVIEELGDGARITEISTEINGSVSPLAIIDSKKTLGSSVGRISLESELTYRLKKASSVLIGRDFVPWRTDDQEQAVLRSGRWDFRLFYYPGDGGQRIKYAGTRSYQDGSLYVNETTNERYRSDGISWAFSAAGRADVLLSASISNRSRSSGSTQYSIKGHQETASTDYRFSEFWILKAGLGFQVTEQTDLDIRSTVPSAELGLTREFMKVGRASITVSYFRMFVDPEGSYIPYQVASGKSEGDNFLAGARTRLELYQNGRLDFSYRYENFSRRPERHNLKVEFTILFR
jgi:hypothetical protein